MSDKKKFLRVLAFYFVTTCTIGFIGFYTGSKLSTANQVDTKKNEEKENNQVAQQAVTSPVCSGHRQEGYADLVEKLLPAVVNIATKGVEEVSITNPFEQFFGRGGGANPFNDEMFEQFFGGRNSIKRKISSVSSGFFIDDKGFIVTNYHVIKDATNIFVTTQDKKEFKAKVIGFDKKTDLAVLKINPENTKIHYVKFGSSNTSRPGDIAIAIGNPFNFGGTVTVGVISAKSRKMNGSYDDFIQIDAPINFGNSGGPTFNIKGEVIGINNVIVSPSGGNVGIGFAIASDMAKPIIEKLKEGKILKRGMIGIVLRPMTKELSEAVGLSGSVRGGFVDDVVKGGPADNAGVKKGDVILKFDDKEVHESNDLPSIVGNTDIGKKVDVDILRFGKKMTVKITIKEQEDIDQGTRDNFSNNKKDEKIDGLVVRSLNNELRDKFRIPDEINGVFVIKINNDDIIEDGFIEAGDVITQINERKITQPSDLKTALNELKSAKKKKAIFYIFRKGTAVINVISIG